MRITSRGVRPRVLLLAGAACVNLGAGIALALRDPARASDLWAIYDWCRGWLFHGERLYSIGGAAADYPPNAIVLLSPLAVIPRSWVVPLWTILALALVPLLPYLVMRAASRGDRYAIATPMLLFLCWTCARTLLQFSVLSMTLAMLSMRWADSRPIASGMSLGLALAKPHIAGPIALWMIATQRLRVLLVAAVVVVSGWGIYDGRVGENPLATVAGYWQVLRAIYSGPDGLTGRTSLRAWMLAGTADPRMADAIWIGVSGLLVLGVWLLANRDPRRRLDAGGLAVPGLFCLCSLLTIYHNVNNLILMLPAFAFLWFLDSPRTAPRRWVPIVLLQAALTVDVPTRFGRFVADGGWTSLAVNDFDRILVLATFAYVAATWYRLTRRPMPGVMA